jgi:hypothetical protein
MDADEIGRILDELGERIGPAGERVMELAIRQVYIDAALAVIGWLVLVAIGALVARPLYRWVQDGGSYSSRDLGALLVGVAWGGALAFTTIALAIGLSSVLNPEYAALRDLIGAVR